MVGRPSNAMNNPTPTTDATRERFKRENRYIVIKRKDAEKYLNDTQQNLVEQYADLIGRCRTKDGKSNALYVVVESDWPEYEPTWAAIEARMTGAAQPAPAPQGLREAVSEVVFAGYPDTAGREQGMAWIIQRLMSAITPHQPSQPALSATGTAYAADGTPTDEQRKADTEHFRKWMDSRVNKNAMPDRDYVWNAACAYARRTVPSAPSSSPPASAQIWCAACGKWGNHGSGTCPTIAREGRQGTTERVMMANNSLLAEVKDLRSQLATLRANSEEMADSLDDLLMHGTKIKDNGIHGEYVYEADPKKARAALANYRTATPATPVLTDKAVGEDSKEISDTEVVEWMERHWHDWQKHITTDSDGWAERLGKDAWLESNFRRAVCKAIRMERAARAQGGERK